jgi:hypothetical protein
MTQENIPSMIRVQFKIYDETGKRVEMQEIKVPVSVGVAKTYMQRCFGRLVEGDFLQSLPEPKQVDLSP